MKNKTKAAILALTFTLTFPLWLISVGGYLIVRGFYEVLLDSLEQRK